MQALCILSLHCHAHTLKIWVYYIPLIMQQNLWSTFYQLNFSTPTFQNYDMVGNIILVDQKNLRNTNLQSINIHTNLFQESY